VLYVSPVSLINLDCLEVLHGELCVNSHTQTPWLQIHHCCSDFCCLKQPAQWCAVYGCVQRRRLGTPPPFTAHPLFDIGVQLFDVPPCLKLSLLLLCSHDIKQLAKRKHVYHVTSEDGKSWVAKVVAMPYPWQLHQELSNLGLAPKLTGPLEQCPGKVQVIKMEYLDPADGWMRLERFIGDWDALHEVAMEALESLQSCLEGKAVHGDLNPGNLLVRYALGKCSMAGLSCIEGCPCSTCHMRTSAR